MKTFVGWQTVLGSAKPRDDVKRSQMNAIVLVCSSIRCCSYCWPLPIYSHHRFWRQQQLPQH
ncbi:uncharacterized protein LACBIDRAFT_298728 [Laccaria bicolor S238N-H82]|uniref:Predicted protein n=1 Tax=Laccaria bicolor (strain S238N-H82 / ATCC MYA-4686) TaxID=486041 RepID=B0DDH2_LACBS|nr:uncharacterized protein LACBIDRAFT_298719 [Laccaria bicolor S238N-H82]XP_001882005.1 uncharacterized protein LACBIDRAFT_298728 [Laccaria bicolor S238N-H82]EDR07609.1 predicted protein [Laccaria bicolor S238N-H82]EDR07613.1 predicted protein [Laccaria bicolor S238N-H82]|eukprot:XP_001882001.1 predicted protein [Laccaria bicolor S238N-H82]